MKETYIDRIFRSYGEEHFGKDVMDTVTSEQLEEARCFTFHVLYELTSDFGRQSQGTDKEIFFKYINDCILQA